MPNDNSARGGKGVRIIGGQWRGRRLFVPPVPGVRPTGDRTRETLFNWLAPIITGARCLDLFAGSGALGIEALSRGAAESWLVEKNTKAVQSLHGSLASLGCTNAKVVRQDALKFLHGTPTKFDLVFLDPPFGDIDLEILCTLLEDNWLTDGAHIYIELHRRGSLPALPPTWTVDREKTAGQVRFLLAKRA
jgi:16S rRNA (guanine966-N2)-methyltransferase